jgi:FAD/FMN-containing dehydrogenase
MLGQIVSHGLRRYIKATALRHLTVPILRATFDAYVEFTNHVGPHSAQSACVFEYVPLQKIKSVPGDATAYNNRGDWLNVIILPTWGTRTEFDAYGKEWVYKLLDKFIALEKLDETVPEGKEVVCKKGYFNASMGDEKVSVVFGENYPRLRELKRKYDPDCVFKKWFPITPAEA